MGSCTRFRVLMSIFKPVGADLALNHGAVVDLDGTVYYEWLTDKGLSLSPEELWNRARIIAEACPVYCEVAFDWDRTSGGWGNDPRVGQLITMLVSFTSAILQSRGCRVLYITPSKLRDCLGFLDSASKVDVHAAFKSEAPVFENDKHKDKMEAWLLAKVSECSRNSVDFTY